MGNVFGRDRGLTCSAIGPVKQDEFHVALDSKAFEFNMLSKVSSMRITKLDNSGKWHIKEDGVFTEAHPFEDDGLQIVPQKNSATLKLTSAIEALFLGPSEKPQTLLCYNNLNPVVYINLKLRRKRIEPGTYILKDNSMLYYNKSIVIVNLPDAPVKPSLQQILEKSYDPGVLFVGLQNFERKED